MRYQHRMISGIILSLLLISVSSHARKWEKLGLVRTVNHKLDRDVILVGPGKGPFTALKLTVKDAGLHLLDMKVHFGNGDVQDVEIRKLIPRGGVTRVIDLQGKDRKIKKVIFWYKTPKRKNKQAKVRLWGRQ